jgi:ATP-dependent Clp protease ATP-binding subunit ClpC
MWHPVGFSAGTRSGRGDQSTIPAFVRLADASQLSDAVDDKIIEATLQGALRVFERYTEKARRTIFFARYEAGSYGSPHIETEHLLAGLLRADTLLARSILQRPGAGESIRKELGTKRTDRKSIPSNVEIPLSGESRYVLRFAAKAAAKLGHQHVDNIHLLLGILRQEECLAARILLDHGVESEALERIIEKHID